MKTIPLSCRALIISVIVTVAAVLVLSETAFAGTISFRETGSKTWRIYEDGKEHLHSSTVTEYSGKHVTLESTTYHSGYEDPSELWTRYKYRKGKLRSETTNDPFGYVTRKNYAYKRGKISKAVIYKKNKKTGKYKKYSVVTYKYRKNKIIETEKNPKWGLMKKVERIFDKKGRLSSVIYYDQNEFDSSESYKYYKNGALKSHFWGDELGHTKEYYNKDGLIVSEESEDYCDDGTSNYEYRYRDFCNGDRRYPRIVEKYVDGDFLERTEFTYERA